MNPSRKLFIPLVFMFAWMGLNVLNLTVDDQKTDCRQVLKLPSLDSTFINPVYLCTDSSGSYFYYATLETTVCNDTLCQIVVLNVYWDLGGYYTHFDTIQGKPLTKYDHNPFTFLDYQKLHMTLGDERSILGEKSRGELLDKSETRYSEKMDAVTGATAREIRSAVVEGALYSTYTLWHLINGDIRQKLWKNTLLIYNPKIESQLLNSTNPRTKILALKMVDDSYYFNHFDEIIQMMQSGNPLLNFYIAKKIPEGVFDIEKNRNSISSIWNLLDFNTQSVLRNYLDP